MHKILKIVALVLSLAGIGFLIGILAKGDEAIKAGDNAVVDFMSYVAYVVLFIILLSVIIFVFKNLFSNTGSLKNTLIGIGAFLAVLIVSYAVSGGDTMVYKYGGNPATEGESHLVGAGLIAFYVLILTAAGAMLFSGIKKLIK